MIGLTKRGRRKLIWEVASLPLMSFMQTSDDLDAQAKKITAQSTDLDVIQRELYGLYSQAVFGTALPMPHFYLGNNMSGDLKFRSPLSLTLTGGEYLRAYYTPYPLLFIDLNSFQYILNDLAFGNRLHAPKSYDYKGRYTPELIEAEYNRIQELVQQPDSIIGLTVRSIKKEFLLVLWSYLSWFCEGWNHGQGTGSDDNAYNRDIFQIVLENLDYQVDVETNGRECLDALSRDQYELVILDLEMPEMAGNVVLQKIRISSS